MMESVLRFDDAVDHGPRGLNSVLVHGVAVLLRLYQVIQVNVPYRSLLFHLQGVQTRDA